VGLPSQVGFSFELVLIDKSPPSSLAAFFNLGG
jgi:hypothetical protein